MQKREQFAFECRLNYVVDSDVRYFWLLRLGMAQSHSFQPVTVNNKGFRGWNAKNASHLYLKALQCHLGDGYEVRIKFTRWLLKPFIEVSWAPITGGE